MRRAAWLLALALAGCPQVRSGDDVDLAVTFDLATVDATADAPCRDECPTEGGGQCTPDGLQLRMCVRDGACLKLAPPADCGADMLCCAGRCVANDESHCGGCAVQCAAPTPKCDTTLMRCVCTPQACAAVQHDCNATLGICETCDAPPVPETRTDFYVDRAASVTATGSLGCPYPTIGDALTAAGQNNIATQKTVHIAAGTYSAEVFPLVVRHGISLVGAGADQTIIQGAGTLDHSAAAGALNGANYQVTIAAGDSQNAVTLSSLSVVAPSPSPIPANTFGVFCDQGSAVNAIMNPPSPSPYPAATLLLDQVTVGPGYQYGVAATTTSSPQPSGCNLKMTASTVTGNLGGLWAVGCGTFPGVVRVIVAAQLGDTTPASGNRFTNNRNGSNNGAGIVVWDCVTPIVALNNTFDSDDIGMAIGQHPRCDTTIPLYDLDIEKNTFSNLSNEGIELSACAVIDQLLGNVFTGITAAVDHGYRGIGVNLIGSQSVNNPMSFRPQIKRARGNQFIGNDLAIELRGPVQIVPDPDQLDTDFGKAGNPGGNVFRCNSTPASAAGGGLLGYDVLVSAGASGGGTAHFEGNQWDHATPTVTTTAPAANGEDVLLSGGAPQSTIDDAGGSLSALMCPATNVPGP